ncbi:ABC transporter permease [Mumia sp. Pv 4-285]|uniref:ABC transporter permease n=1 Tax=Mumia qirimensis TaxID=3234852 RepID=UPI00351D927C
MRDLVDVVRAELAALVRRPGAWALLATAVVLSMTFAYLIPYISYRSGQSPAEGADAVSPEQLLASTLPDQLVPNTLDGFPVFAGALALVLGALVAGSQYGFGTLKTLLVQRPGRLTVAAGQTVALVLSVGIGVLVLFGVGAIASTAIALGAGRTVAFPAPAHLLPGMAGGWLVLTMWATIGACLATVLRSVALPIGLGVVWVLGVENLVAAVASSVLTGMEPVRDLLPGASAGSLVAALGPEQVGPAAPGVTDALSGGRALVTVAAYVVVAVGVGWWRTRRRDVV